MWLEKREEFEAPYSYDSKLINTSSVSFKLHCIFVFACF
ncbi:unnamed protein product [Schistosoma curassoni]|uniref:Uncharacterized protein n=1 Tax=Schistosoma curassoni TaxID=6186 RepID=A0A183KZA4_9TREM|nr:unnamed protein product [Schistosoma curassoni]